MTSGGSYPSPSRRRISAVGLALTAHDATPAARPVRVESEGILEGRFSSMETLLCCNGKWMQLRCEIPLSPEPRPLVCPLRRTQCHHRMQCMHAQGSRGLGDDAGGRGTRPARHACAGVVPCERPSVSPSRQGTASIFVWMVGGRRRRMTETVIHGHPSRYLRLRDRYLASRGPATSDQ